MKNSFLIIIFVLILNSKSFAENVSIQAKNITLDKNNQISIFENDVIVTTEEGNEFKCNYVEYNRQTGILKLKENVVVKDKRNNLIETKYAEYNEKSKIFKSTGATKVITTELYKIDAEDILFDSKQNIIISEKKATIQDRDDNKIFIENFEYQSENNIFKSVGKIQILDKKGNSYNFSQIYIDTKKKEILGTDIKVFLNQEDFKVNQDNKPRIFANMINLNDQTSTFKKSIFTLCNYRKEDKCPPWTIQASEMLHNNKNKTIYYDNAVIKVYNIPIFYFPRLSHPDPTVERRSGFLPPSLSDTKNLGLGVSVPYFFAIEKDKNFTLTSRIFTSENPLFLGEYHQAFKNSSLLADFGYTAGYKNTSASKKPGEKSHFFLKYVKNFLVKSGSDNSLSLTVQDVSNDKYLKLYKIKSNLVDYSTNTLESSLSFTHEKDDLFLGLNASIYETLKDSYNDKYEYIIPELTLDKNLFNDDKFGNLDLQTNLKIHNYDTNKLSNFFINDLNWASKDLTSKKGIKSKLLGNIKNINYEAKNIDLYKEEPTSELFGAFGYFTELELEKDQGNKKHFLTPKFFVRFSPGSMRKENDGSRLDPISAFSLDRLDNINNFETGLTGTLGFDYKFKNNNKDFDFSLAQIINEKENKKMSSKSSLDEKLSDLVGTASLDINDNISLNYNFAMDQNYKDLNYNEIGTSMNFNSLNIDFNFLQEKKHIGDQEYFKTKLDYNANDNSQFSFETKRNLITNSAEFYNLSYEYINDCLRAGLVYRREFYTDSELEPENSLMFKITLTPFGNINSPTFSQ